MKVKLAKTAGFCMGVRRAMDLVLEAANKAECPLYTLGPLIHNRQVMELLASKGVTPLERLQGEETGAVVIRAHGIPPEQRKELKRSGLRMIDATCPRVARVQGIIRYHTKKGYTAVIVGDKDHPEVTGLMGYGVGRARVITRPSDVLDLPEAEKVLVVAQTTQDAGRFREIVETVRKRFPEARVFDTICEATHHRQEEVRSFAGHVDGMVVVGGHHSANTQRLAEVSRAAGLCTFQVETEKELDREKLASMEVIGVTAGASTPNWMIRNVVKEIEAIRSRRETFLGRWIARAFKFLLLSNGLVALGAFCLSCAAAVLIGRSPDPVHPSLAFLYIYAMHVLNRFLDKGASTYNDPERAAFYRKHRRFLVITGLACILGALALAYHLGPLVFLAMAGLSALGVIYSITIVPMRLRPLWRYSKIKDVPGSKTLSEALAWGVVITLVPLLETPPIMLSAAVFSFLYVFSIVYVRSALFDIFQIQGDLIVGVETLPLTLGEEKTLLLLKGVVGFAALVLLVSPALSPLTSFSYLLLGTLLTMLLSLLTYQKRWLYPGPRLEALVEANFFLAGLLGLLWQQVG